MRNNPLLLLLMLIGLFIPCGVRASDEGLVDPTRPPGNIGEAKSTEETPADAMKLTLIRLGADPLAVINGKNVQPGQSIDGYRLLSLQARSATLAGSSGRIVLELTPSLRKPTALSSPHSLPHSLPKIR